MKPMLIACALRPTLRLSSPGKTSGAGEALPNARAVSAPAKRLGSTPIPTDVDTKQPAASTAEPRGGMVIPQNHLMLEAIPQNP